MTAIKAAGSQFANIRNARALWLLQSSIPIIHNIDRRELVNVETVHRNPSNGSVVSAREWLPLPNTVIMLTGTLPPRKKINDSKKGRNSRLNTHMIFTITFHELSSMNWKAISMTYTFLRKNITIIRQFTLIVCTKCMKKFHDNVHSFQQLIEPYTAPESSTAYRRIQMSISTPITMPSPKHFEPKLAQTTLP